jgi:hypothetical protein
VEYDLRALSFDEWVRFIFDHPVEAEDSLNAWYFASDEEPVYDAESQLTQLTRLFRDPAFLRDGYSSEQIEQGFWLLFGAAGEHFADLIWWPAVAWDRRRGCIDALPALYEELFASESIGDVDYMIPDLLADGYRPAVRESGEDADRVRDALLEAFRRILDLSAPHCRRAALHGIGHLGHPSGAAIVDQFLATHPQLPEDERDYAERAKVGQIL